MPYPRDGDVGDGEADEVEGHRDLAPIRLVKQRTGVDPRRLSPLQQRLGMGGLHGRFAETIHSVRYQYDLTDHASTSQ